MLVFLFDVHRPSKTLTNIWSLPSEDTRTTNTSERPSTKFRLRYVECATAELEQRICGSRFTRLVGRVGLGRYGSELLTRFQLRCTDSCRDSCHRRRDDKCHFDIRPTHRQCTVSASTLASCL